MRRWHVGRHGIVDGIPFRVMKGDRHPDDLRLDWHISGLWRPPQMLVGAFLADFFSENEDAIRPPPRFWGGEYYLNYLYRAAAYGYEKPDATLRAEVGRART